MTDLAEAPVDIQPPKVSHAPPERRFREPTFGPPKPREPHKAVSMLEEAMEPDESVEIDEVGRSDNQEEPLSEEQMIAQARESLKNKDPTTERVMGLMLDEMEGAPNKREKDRIAKKIYAYQQEHGIGVEKPDEAHQQHGKKKRLTGKKRFFALFGGGIAAFMALMIAMGLKGKSGGGGH